MTWTFTQDNFGLVEADAGPARPGFNDTLRDSIGSRAPKGWPPGLSTYWVDRAIEGVTSGTEGSIFLSGNSTELILAGTNVVARSEYEAFSDESMSKQEFLQQLQAWRREIVRLQAVSGDWPRLLAQPTAAVRNLSRADVPTSPGVYLWQRGDEFMYVGKATSLVRRAWGSHLGRGLSLAGSSLRRNVCALLFDVPPNVTGSPLRQKVTIEQAASIRAWLDDCKLSWISCETVIEALELETRLRREYLPKLNRV